VFGTGPEQPDDYVGTPSSDSSRATRLTLECRVRPQGVPAASKVVRLDRRTDLRGEDPHPSAAPSTSSRGIRRPRGPSYRLVRAPRSASRGQVAPDQRVEQHVCRQPSRLRQQAPRRPPSEAGTSIRRSRWQAPAPRAPPADAGTAARRSADLRSARSGWHRARAA
jgi:hypothetical protein